MSKAKLTLWGMEKFLAYSDKSLFDDIILPEGVDKDVLCNNILMQGGEFEILYADPGTMHAFIDLWFKKNYRTFDKWVYALAQEYAPLDNYDRHEEWTDSMTSTGTSSDNSTNQTDMYQTGYDSDTLHQTARSTSDNTGGTSANSTGNNVHTGHLWGNIGVTTSSAMLEEFLNIQQWNIYEHITDMFLDAFCIMVYE